MKWRQVEPGRLLEEAQGAGPRMQLVWRGKRWQVQAQPWIPGTAAYLAPLHIGTADTLADAKALAESHGRAG